MPGGSPFSVGSLLNTSRADGARRTPSSSVITDNSDMGAATATDSSVGSPLVGLLSGRSASPRTDMSSVSPSYTHQRHLRGVHPGAPTSPSAVAGLPLPVLPHTGSYGGHGHALDQPPPAASAAAAAYAVNYWQRHPHGRQQQQRYGAPHQYQYQHHHAPADYRYWPYPQPPNYMIPRPAAPRHTAGMPYYVHSAPEPLPPPPIPLPQSGLGGPRIPWRRERRSKACLRCHTKKIKCEGEGPTCDGCKLAGCECRWVEMKKRGPKPKRDRIETSALHDGSAAVNTSSQGDSAQDPAAHPKMPDHSHATAIDTQLPHHHQTASATADAPGLANGAALEPSSPDAPVTMQTATMEQAMQRFHSEHVPADTREAVVCFFDHIYARIPVFHPATLVRRIAFGQADALLVDALKLCTLRVTARRAQCAANVDALTTRVHKRLLAGVERPTLDYVRAVLLSASLLEGDAQFLMYSSLACLAASTVMRLGWHTLDLGRGAEEISWEEWVDLEEKRRTFWCVYQLDSHHGLISDRPMTIDKSHIFISTPGSDYTWDDVTMPQIMNWPTRHQPDIRRDVIVRMGALSYAFIEQCNLSALVSQIAEFLWEARVGVHVPPGEAGWSAGIPFMPMVAVPAMAVDRLPVRSLADYPEFRQLHDALHEWKARLIPAEDMKSDKCAPVSKLEQVGSLENRRFAMRLRYFSLRCQLTPLLHLLHFANRPSFFDPDRQVPRRFGQVVAFAAAVDSDKERVLRDMMSRSLAEMHNDGCLAFDVADESWEACLQEAYALLEHLDRNSDIPVERLDGSLAFCLFTSCTVLLRHIRMCHAKAGRHAVVGDASVPSTEAGQQKQLAALHEDTARAAAALRRMWAILKDVGLAWGVKDAEKLLRTMHIEEAAGSAGLLA
ncbi:hypothetical protein LPJ61_001398 [Coemansia biformis]|uniref:Zn(2)-C6 fungal-type domain-containing protein n=1 Tax=Coemansia biformis TaxID=1286918 RepID=A0A9W8CZM4_9FUNG|nr:hypothetical protein LPJ61_001398 [Coemansia biformis]